MLVLFQPSVAHATAAVPAVLPTTHHSPNVDLSGVVCYINIKHTQNSVVSEPTRQSVHLQRLGCTAAAAAWQLAAGWEESRLVNTAATGVSNYSHFSCDCG